jgi:hypothetical protein
MMFQGLKLNKALSFRHFKFQVLKIVFPYRPIKEKQHLRTRLANLRCDLIQDLCL